MRAIAFALFATVAHPALAQEVPPVVKGLAPTAATGMFAPLASAWRAPVAVQAPYAVQVVGLLPPVQEGAVRPDIVAVGAVARVSSRTAALRPSPQGHVPQLGRAALPMAATAGGPISAPALMAVETQGAHPSTAPGGSVASASGALEAFLSTAVLAPLALPGDPAASVARLPGVGLVGDTPGMAMAQAPSTAQAVSVWARNGYVPMVSPMAQAAALGPLGVPPQEADVGIHPVAGLSGTVLATKGRTTSKSAALPAVVSAPLAFAQGAAGILPLAADAGHEPHVASAQRVAQAAASVLLGSPARPLEDSQITGPVAWLDGIDPAMVVASAGVHLGPSTSPPKAWAQGRVGPVVAAAGGVAPAASALPPARAGRGPAGQVRAQVADAAPGRMPPPVLAIARPEEGAGRTPTVALAETAPQGVAALPVSSVPHVALVVEGDVRLAEPAPMWPLRSSPAQPVLVAQGAFAALVGGDTPAPTQATVAYEWAPVLGAEPIPVAQVRAPVPQL